MIIILLTSQVSSLWRMQTHASKLTIETLAKPSEQAWLDRHIQAARQDCIRYVDDCQLEGLVGLHVGSSSLDPRALLRLVQASHDVLQTQHQANDATGE